MCSFYRGNIEGTNSSKIYVWCLWMYVLCLRSDWLTEGWCICEKSLEMCICFWPEFDCPEVTLCGWQDIKIQLQLLFSTCRGWWGECISAALTSLFFFGWLRYEAGDHVGVYPINDLNIVEKIGKRLDVDLDTVFSLNNVDGQFNMASLSLCLCLFLSLAFSNRGHGLIESNILFVCSFSLSLSLSLSLVSGAWLFQ